MNTTQMSRGAQIAGAAGLVLLIDLFLPWYSVDVEAGGFSASDSGNAWEVFGGIDVLLFLAAIIAIGIAVASMQNKAAALPVPPAQVLLGVGALATLLVLFRLISVPDGGASDVAGVDVGRSIGPFIGLVASGAIAYAGTLLAKE